jgi:hypothetical protein
MERMRATINARNHQRMIEETGMEVNAEDPTTTKTMALTAKYPQDTKITATKATTIKARDTVTTEKKITESFNQGNPESITHH